MLRYKVGPTVTAENDAVMLCVSPSDGGRLTRIFDKENRCELLWTNKRTAALSRVYGGNYDVLSAGGVEEAFPTVFPCVLGELELPFFGEIWAVPWDCTAAVFDEELCITLTCMTAQYAARVVKTIRLRGRSIKVDYQIENIGAEAFPYVFGVHPSICVYGDTEVSLPAGTYVVDYAGKEKSLLKKSVAWPVLEGLDLRYPLPFENNACYNLVNTAVEAGKYAFLHREKQSALSVSFRREDFPVLSVWLIYGGWRGHYCAMTEFFTAWPAVLSDTAPEKAGRILQAGQQNSFGVLFEVLSGGAVTGARQ